MRLRENANIIETPVSTIRQSGVSPARRGSRVAGRGARPARRGAGGGCARATVWSSRAASAKLLATRRTLSVRVAYRLSLALYGRYFIALFVPQLDGFIKSLRITVTTI